MQLGAADRPTHLACSIDANGGRLIKLSGETHGRLEIALVPLRAIDAEPTDEARAELGLEQARVAVDEPRDWL